MHDFPDATSQLFARIEALEHRVKVLEAATDVPIAANVVPIHPRQDKPVHPPASVPDSSAIASGIFPMLGKATLGIAGAYLLRAIAEAGYLPALAIDVLAIAYAAMWLVFASRVKTEAWFAGIIYSSTSGLILAPMLWEMTLRFQYLSPEAAAVVLGCYAIAATVLAWQRKLIAVYWAATFTAVSASLALMLATHNLVPFILALLAIAIASEFAVLRGSKLHARFLIAAAVDLAIWAMAYLYSAPASLPSDYHSVATPVLLAIATGLFLLYVASILYRNIIQQTNITLFEIFQLMAAFLLTAYAWLMPFGHSLIPLGATCLVAGIVVYGIVFLRFEDYSLSINYHVYGAWALALLLIGTILTLPHLLLSIALGAAAIVATIAGIRRDCLTLKYHGMVYLVAVAAVSGLMEYIGNALAGTLPPSVPVTVCIGMAAAIACYLCSWKNIELSRRARIPQIVSAVFSACIAASLLIALLAFAASILHAAGPHQLAFIRTLVSCSLALALAYLGSHMRHIELVWIAYGALIFIAAKLFFEDLRLGHLAFIAASLVFYAAALIFIPRLARPIASGPAGSQKISLG